MKILLLYTPRSGTNSLCKYFLKQYPNYIYFNQPWSNYKVEEEIRYCPYEDCIKYDDVLIKSEIQNFFMLEIPKEKVFTDFDKVLIMNRKNKKEQAISFIIANKSSNFLGTKNRKYFIDTIDENRITEVINQFNKSELLFDNFNNDKTMYLSYEDIYHEKKIDTLFDYLNLSYIEKDYQDILDSKNRYFTGKYETKTKKSIL